MSSNHNDDKDKVKMNGYVLKPIGFIRSEHQETGKTPIQPVFAEECRGVVDVSSEFLDGLKDIEGFSHIQLLYWLHKAGKPKMLQKPFLEDIEHGLFATRFPARPNPIGLSTVRLIKREGTKLFIEGVDILDGTPLLDIKPYCTRFDCFPEAKNGWYARVEKKEEHKRGRRGYRKNPDAGNE